LQRAREAAGLSIEDLSRRTKISKATLTAIESSDILRLPAEIYTRGFVKSYAAEIGLPPDQTADDYLTGIEPLIHHVRVDDGVPPALADHAHHDVHASHDPRQLLVANPMRRFSRLTTLAAGIGLVVYVVSFTRGGNGQDAIDTTAPSAAITDATRTGSTKPANGQPDAVIAADGAFHLVLVSDGPCWLVATVDGQRVIAKLLQAGERQTLSVTQEALLRVGEPGALSISINGQTVRPLGARGQPVNVRITKENFREFLPS
jgi:cytoskeleton protein RodZ